MAPTARRGVVAWDDAFGALRDFAKRHGHCRVPRDLTVQGVSLYSWAARQRAGRARLTASQRRRLEGIPGWAWNRKDAAWERTFALLEFYVTEHGDACVLRSYCSGGIALGKWVNKQRAERRALSEDRRRKLERLPGWRWQARASAWEERLHLLRDFVREHGHARVPRTHRVGDVGLGAWAGRQRLAYRRGVLAPNRVAALEALPGWQWHLSRGSRSAVSAAA
jgi:hypothetical protein